MATPSVASTSAPPILCHREALHRTTRRNRRRRRNTRPLLHKNASLAILFVAVALHVVILITPYAAHGFTIVAPPPPRAKQVVKGRAPTIPTLLTGFDGGCGDGDGVGPRRSKRSKSPTSFVTVAHASTTATVGAEQATTKSTASSQHSSSSSRIHHQSRQHNAPPAPHQVPQQTVRCPELDQWREYDTLRSSGLDDAILGPFFASRPHLIAGRLYHVLTTLRKAKRDWDESAPADDDGTSKFAADMLRSNNSEGESEQQRQRRSKLCAAVSSLGPVAVKVAQTLSQRPDLVGPEAAKAFQTLTTANAPFDDELAWAVLKENLNWEGDVAPGIGVGLEESGVTNKKEGKQGQNEDKKTLFASITPHPVASASLGQVYRATTHAGRTIAVKIQRPDAMSILAQDAMCFRLVFRFREFVQIITDSQTADEKVRGKQNVGSVIDRVAKDVLDELNYEQEAKNGMRYRKSLLFLGFVDTPTVLPEYTSDRVLVTEWINGHHLSHLTEEEGLKMTRMAVEACTASLVLTGYVHADPHEGNLMLSQNYNVVGGGVGGGGGADLEGGRLVFLDFGLMSSVSQTVMEAFARGIQGTLSQDWDAVTQAFKDTGFITDPIMHRASLEDEWRVYGIDEQTGEDLGMEQLSKDLAKAMGETEGGTSRFGALATVLNKKISPNWLLFTPPYVLLLIRTFLTLEGIAAKVDPEFNIYEMAMPWAIRRALSPETDKGIETFRNTLLTEDHKVQWDRFVELASAAAAAKDSADNNGAVEGRDDTRSSSSSSVPNDETHVEHADAMVATTSSTAASDAKEEDEEQMKKVKMESNKSAQKSAMSDAIGSLLGSPDGRALRRALKDVDSTDLIARLVSREARPLRHAAIVTVANSLRLPFPSRRRKEQRIKRKRTKADESTAMDGGGGNSIVVEGGGMGKAAATSAAASTTSVNDRPVSRECERLRQRQNRWKRKVSKLLLLGHLNRQLTSGWRGFWALARLSFLSVRIAIGAFFQTIMARVGLGGMGRNCATS